MFFEAGIVLAAGEGRRMRPLTLELPKPLLPTPERSLLAHQLRFLKQFCSTIYVTKGYKSDLLEKWAENLGAHGTLDTTGHGNAYFLRYLSEFAAGSKILVLTCDNILNIDVNALAEDINSNPDSHTLIALENKLVQTADRLQIALDGSVTAIGPQIPTHWIATGMQVLSRDKIPNKAYENFYEFWSDAINGNSLRVSGVGPISWQAFDTPESLISFRYT